MYSPLMLFLKRGFEPQQNTNQEERYKQFLKAGDSLIQYCAGAQTPIAKDHQVGASALMIGVTNFTKVKTEPLLRKLLPLERELVDAEGCGWKQYAASAGLSGEVECW